MIRVLGLGGRWFTLTLDFHGEENHMPLSRRTFLATGAAAGCAAIAGEAAGLQEKKAAEPAQNLQVPRIDVADRMPEIPAEKMTPEQKKAAAEFAAGRGTPVFGPFVPLLRSPEVMLRAKAMGDYLRFKTVLPPRLNEFAILITARQWTQQYEWAVHHPIALKAGLNPEIARAVAEGRRPQSMPEEEEIVYEFCTELHRNQSVSDATYARALGKFGEQGIIDLTGVNGYYTLLAMVLNTARTALPKGAAPPLAPFPR
jgi:4-carboxymuconolactone decarboxylase